MGLVLLLLIVIAFLVSRFRWIRYYGDWGIFCELHLRNGLLIAAYGPNYPSSSLSMGWSVVTPFSGFVWSPRVAVWQGGGSVVLPLWIAFLLVALPTAVLWWRDRRFPPGHCPQCGYNLTGNTSAVCSECGSPAPAAHLPVSGAASVPDAAKKT
ncbi:MAG: hypothetical protein AMXMBFR13_42110 [Phycisphaerae bacterium]